MKATTTLTCIILALTSLTPATGFKASIEPNADRGHHHHDHAEDERDLTDDRQAMLDEQRHDAPGVYGAGAALEARIQATIEGFAAVGLELPPVRIYVHPSDEACRGWAGLFNEDGSGTRVDLCHEIVLIHELAHVWEHHHLDDEHRQRLMEHVGAEVWANASTPHHERGIEIVANVIADGVRGAPISARLTDVYAEHLELFELVTGMPSPRLVEYSAHDVSPVAPTASGTEPTDGPS